MDIEKTIEFILSTQAKHEAAVQKHDEEIAELRSSIGELRSSIGELRPSVATVTDLVGRLAQAEIRLVERTDRLASGFEDLRKLHADTEYKLNALIDAVDKLVRRDGNQQSPSPA